MTIDSLQKLFEHEAGQHALIEPDSRFDAVNSRLVDCLHGYNPAVIVKTGLGNAKYIESIMEHSKALLVVVEPSLVLLKSFFSLHGSKPWIKRFYAIAGNFSQFPVDYYKADMLICIDCLDLLDTGKAVDEFRRALQFNGVFFYSGFVLPNEDGEGMFDAIAHMIHPIHTDYYLEDDLKTFLALNEFNSAKSHVEKIRVDLFAVARYLHADTDDLKRIIYENKDVLAALYDLHEDGTVSVPYMTGAWTRMKPSQGDAL